MEPALNTFFVILMSVVDVFGLLTSGFIVAVYLLDLAKGRCLNTCDRILVVHGISCFCYHSIEVGNISVSASSMEIFDLNSMNPIIILLLTWTSILNCWLTSCLCVFYCVKIVDFNHRFFFRLKLRISKDMPWVLLILVAGSLAFVTPVYWDLYGWSYLKTTANLTANITLTGGGKTLTLSSLLGNVFGYCLPLLLEIASITLILRSLCRHVRQMKENVSAFSQPRLDSHFGAAKMVGSLLLVCASYLLAHCLALSLPMRWLECVLEISDALSALAQSIILIQRNSKLKQTMCKIFIPRIQ